MNATQVVVAICSNVLPAITIQDVIATESGLSVLIVIVMQHVAVIANDVRRVIRRIIEYRRV